MQPVVAFAGFYRDGVKVFETQPATIGAVREASRARPTK